MDETEDLNLIYPHLKNQLGLIHLELKNYDVAKDHFTDLQKISNLDSVDRSFYFSNLAKVYSKVGDNDQANININQAIAWMPPTAKNRLYRFRAYRDAGRYNLNDGNPEVALSYFDKAHQVYEDIELTPDLFDIYRLQSAAFFAVNEFDIAQQLETRYVDALSSWELKSRGVESVFAQSWLESKHAEFVSGQDAKRLRVLQVQSIFIYSVVLLLMVLLVSAIIRVVSKKRAKRTAIYNERIS